jgi:calpain-15
MYIKGEMKEVILDDFIPCISKEKGPAFTSANGPELWVLLLEKAWAKTYGSYDNIEAGLTREPLHDLTGAPTKTIWTD